MRIGIDLGGTKTEGIALDENGKELLRERIATKKDTYESILNGIVSVVSSIEEKLQMKGSVGVGIPGAVSHVTGLVKKANTTELIGKPMDKDLEKLLGRPVRLANDANCFALSEAADGAAKGSSVVFGVILGTGCGGGIVIDGKIINGVNAIAGEWGHNRLPDRTDSERPGSDCFCGHSGCNERYISGTGIAQDHLDVTGKKLITKEIAKLALAGDADAKATISRFEARLARALAVVINILDPDVIVLGGGVSHIDSIYENVPKLWSDYVFGNEVSTKLVKAAHGDSSGVRGAAWLWPHS